jgi:tetratricopeptide (TPR) repeat protein
MKRIFPVILTGLIGFLWGFLPIPPGVARNLAGAVVTVVGLDGQGRPSCHGAGLLEKNGRVITSASLLGHGHGGVIKTAAGELYCIQNLVRWDPFQDLAVVQLESESPGQVDTVPAKKVHSPAKVWVGGLNGKLREAQLVKTLPFSPRLVLMKLEPADLSPAPGSPVFNGRGELVGMLHSFGGRPGKPRLQFFLLRDRAHLPSPTAMKTTQNSLEQEAESSAAIYSAFWAGVAASLQQDWQGAQEKFRIASASPENLPEAYYGRGVARYHLGDFLGAQQDLEEATRRFPGYGLAFLWLGKAWEGQGKSSEAQKAFEKAVATAPELSEAWFRLGELAYQQGKLNRAKECLERSAGDDSLAARSWWYLGHIAQVQNRNEDALKAFTQATQSAPDFFQAYLDGGRLLVEDLGRPQEAIKLLQNAVRLGPLKPLPHYYLAVAYLLSWNPGGAWEQYFALQDISPDLASGLAKVLERSR